MRLLGMLRLVVQDLHEMGGDLLRGEVKGNSWNDRKQKERRFFAEADGATLWKLMARSVCFNLDAYHGSNDADEEEAMRAVRVFFGIYPNLIRAQAEEKFPPPAEKGKKAAKADEPKAKEPITRDTLLWDLFVLNDQSGMSEKASALVAHALEQAGLKCVGDLLDRTGPKAGSIYDVLRHADLGIDAPAVIGDALIDAGFPSRNDVDPPAKAEAKAKPKKAKAKAGAA